MSSTKIGILGCGGRMGRMLIAEIVATPGAELVGGVDPALALAGQDLGTLAGLAPLGVMASTDPATVLEHCDVAIDFTTAAATAAMAPRVAALGKALVIGTTGLDEQETAAVHSASADIPVVWASNFSVGVNLLLGLVERVASTLGPEFDIEILEMHHRMKADAPSGTALSLGHAAATGRQQALEDLWVKTRDGLTGARTGGTIGFAALRGGDVVGDHVVMFAGPGERLELAHKASDRRIFARGAIRAALWAVGRPAGLYGMKQVLDL